MKKQKLIPLTDSQERKRLTYADLLEMKSRLDKFEKQTIILDPVDQIRLGYAFLSKIVFKNLTATDSISLMDMDSFPACFVRTVGKNASYFFYENPTLFSEKTITDLCDDYSNDTYLKYYQLKGFSNLYVSINSFKAYRNNGQGL
jgi:hypothetical protein